MSEQLSHSYELAQIAAIAAQNKIARNILLIDLQEIEFAVTDYFLICTCDSEQQADAVKTSIERAAKDAGFGRSRIEGEAAKEWILLDFFNVVIHIMIEKSRSFYKIEKIWADGNMILLNEKGEFEEFDFSKINTLYSEIEVELPESLPADFWEVEDSDESDEDFAFDFDDYEEEENS